MCRPPIHTHTYKKILSKHFHLVEEWMCNFCHRLFFALIKFDSACYYFYFLFFFYIVTSSLLLFLFRHIVSPKLIIYFCCWFVVCVDKIQWDWFNENFAISFKLNIWKMPRSMNHNERRNNIFHVFIIFFNLLMNNWAVRLLDRHIHV